MISIRNKNNQQIPSFESIEFKLSQNQQHSRNHSIDLDFDLQHISLTYTEQSSIGNLEEQFYTQENKKPQRSHEPGIQGYLNANLKQIFHQRFKRKLKNNPHIFKKQSISKINNIEFSLKENIQQGQSKLISNRHSFKKQLVQNNQISIQKNSFSSKSERLGSIKSKSRSKFQVPEMSEPSIQKKQSISCLKTQVTRSSSICRLKRSESLNSGCTNIYSVKASGIERSASDRYVIGLNDMIYEKRQNAKIRKEFFYLQDPLALKQMINIKSIKLEENSLQSRVHLRKIIQNRVSVHHYHEKENSLKKSRK